MNRIKILQWNLHKNSDNLKTATVLCKDFDVLALQEPPQSNLGVALSKISGFRIIQALEGYRRAVLLVRNGLSVLEYHATPDWCSVDLGWDAEVTTIYSVYSPSPPSQSLTPWDSPIFTFLESNPSPCSVLAGDFNLHSRAWGNPTREDQGAHFLLAQKWDLSCLTPKDMITWHRQGQGTTIDLIWASADLHASTITPPDLAGSDHFAQAITVTAPGARLDCLPRPNWKLAPLDQLELEARHLPMPNMLTTPKDLDQYCNDLITAIQRLIDTLIPKSRGGPPRNLWWNQKTFTAYQDLKHAEHAHNRHPTDTTWDRVLTARATRRRVNRKAGRRSWRTGLHELSKTRQGIFKVADWARCESWKTPNIAHLPALKTGLNQITRTFEGKAKALAQKFFPQSTATIDDLADTTPLPTLTGQATTSIDEVRQVLRRTSDWKAPGNDSIPNGVLNAMDMELAARLCMIVDASWQLGHFPAIFKEAKTVVIPKVGREKDQQDPKAWRPIALLPTIGKAIEKLMANRIRDIAETADLLSFAQHGNRKGRSTETALLALSDQVYTAWDQKGIASTLALDISGAFDTISHERLIRTLQLQGFPSWIITWFLSFLKDRSARLAFNDRISEPFPVQCGVPQGSPLSPILFILYTTPLYQKLEHLTDIAVTAYADDTNITAFGKTIPGTYRALQEAHEICKDWAVKAGLIFNPDKYSLLVFSRQRALPTQRLEIGQVAILPQREVKVLGVIMNRKMSWRPHLNQIHKKLKHQKFALERTMAATWGPKLLHARTLYTAIIRAAITHGSPIWHPIIDDRKPQPTITKELIKVESACIRRVLGAFKSTPIRQLNTEAYIPPIDLWMNQKAARFHQRVDNSSLRHLAAQRQRIKATMNRTTTRPRSDAPRPNKIEQAALDALAWAMPDAKTATITHWTMRCQTDITKSHARRPPTPADTLPSRATLKLHQNLRKHESATLVQLRTGHIGLRAHLLRSRVPEVVTGRCDCGHGAHTPRHIFSYCRSNFAERKQLYQATGIFRDFHRLVSTPQQAQTATRWFLEQGYLPYMRWAEEIALEPDPDTPHE